MKVDTVEGADEGVVYQSHVRRDVDDRVGELEGLAGWEGWRGELVVAYRLIFGRRVKELEGLVGPYTLWFSPWRHPRDFYCEGVLKRVR